ncbi:MAG: ribosome silencing factor [Planctomycetes bacterium]|nr:ribosome silencing factor [Planctomycetota bacterium]
MGQNSRRDLLPVFEEDHTIATSRQLAVACARIADDKKASEIVVLDLRKLNSITDFFVICSTRNERQSQAIAEEVAVAMKRNGFQCRHTEGGRGGPWILEDFGDFVLHVLREEQRKFYDLESLWADAPAVSWARATRRRSNGSPKPGHNGTEA